MKRRQSLWLCCSMIDLKSSNNKNKNKKVSARREENFSAILGKKSKRSNICLCCYMIEASPSSPASPHEGQTGNSLN